VSSHPEIQAMFGRVAPRYDLLNHVLCGGTDLYWRWRLGRQVRRQKPARLLDLACGSGDVLRALNRAGAFAEMGLGADFALPMLQTARNKGVHPLCAADALQLPFADGAFDAVTVAFGLRNFADRPAGLREIHRVLKTDGRVYILEFSHPHPFLRKPYFGYLRHVLPRLSSFLTPEKSAYEYLAESIREFPTQPQLLALMRDTGFAEVRYANLTGGIVALHSGRKN
jgi:demethylmenaquinone methyltransferase/2-methoxy-6-polyprenyl-1,4-benzoquinol methylase